MVTKKSLGMFDLLSKKVDFKKTYQRKNYVQNLVTKNP